MSRISQRHLFRLLAVGTGLLVLSTMGLAGSAVGQLTPVQDHLEMLAGSESD